MNGPNKTVASARKRMGGFPERDRSHRADPFVEWIADWARKNPTTPCPWRTVEEAREAFNQSEQNNA